MQPIRLGPVFRIIPSTLIFITVLSLTSGAFARPNLALSRTAKASSTQSADLAAANAFDGDASTRWSSTTADSQWIFVDFGEKDTVDSAYIIWENAAAKEYLIQAWASDVDTPSYNDNGWTTLAHITNGTAAEKRSITFAHTPARYVRMRSVSRATAYGVSMYEMELYGNTPACPIPAIVKQPSNTKGIIDWPVPFRIVVNGLNLSYQWQRSGNGTTWADVTTGTGANSPTYAFTPAATDSGAQFRCAVTSPCGNTVSKAVTLSVSKKKPARTNIALNTIAKSSAVQSGFLPGFAVDGTVSQASRWSSAGGDSSWIFVDLGAYFTIDSLAIYWEHAGAKKYSVQVWSLPTDTPSFNDKGWTTLLTDTTLYYQPPPADWCTSFLKVTPTKTRYVRIRDYLRLTGYGCSIFELEVYGTPVPVAVASEIAPEALFSAVNMTRTPSGIRFSTDRGLPIVADIFSIQGRLVRRLTEANDGFWNFRDQTGGTAKNGMYFAKVIYGGKPSTMRIDVCR
jgi:hypothetical protein